MGDDARTLLVVTGDHALPDATKRGGTYNAEDTATHEAMTAAFRSLGKYEVEVWSDHRAFLERLDGKAPDLVVNFCDTGLYNIATQELHLPALLEVRGIPYTGAPPSAMVICYDKAIVRMIAEAEGVPVPREVFVARAEPVRHPADLYPALIKPNTADGSVGITKDAVVRTPEESEAYCRWLRGTLPTCDILIQEYLPGAEYGIGLIGNPDAGLNALPPLEVDFSALPDGLAPILSYESKAMPDSPYWTDIAFRAAAIAPDMQERMVGWTKRLFARLSLRDYGRFDFRVAADGTPRLMEVNPNPAWANDGKLALMAGQAGMTYPELLDAIVEAAFARIASA
jgi:D-alanine-D-alanine ligase